MECRPLALGSTAFPLCHLLTNIDDPEVRDFYDATIRRCEEWKRLPQDFKNNIRIIRLPTGLWKDLLQDLDVSVSIISERLARAGFSEISTVIVSSTGDDGAAIMYPLATKLLKLQKIVYLSERYQERTEKQLKQFLNDYIGQIGERRIESNMRRLDHARPFSPDANVACIGITDRGQSTRHVHVIITNPHGLRDNTMRAWENRCPY